MRVIGRIAGELLGVFSSGVLGFFARPIAVPVDANVPKVVAVHHRFAYGLQGFAVPKLCVAFRRL